MERAELKRWLSGLGCAQEHGSQVFLCDPHWSDAERSAASALMQVAETNTEPAADGWLCIRTGGSSGGLKFARHDERTLGAAVDGFCRHFDLERVNAVGVLPPWHVSGLMARFRCAATGGRYIGVDWRTLEAGAFPSLPEQARWVLSLVPTQLHRLVQSPAAIDWLGRFEIIFLGGGPIWPELAERAAEARLPVSLSYGMTETAAMVAAQRPAEFLAGDRSAGRPMPHATIAIDGDGRVRIAASSLFRGYFPETSQLVEFETQDLGRIDANGRLHVLGRLDAVIITGGKKVQPAEVEAALRASGEFSDVAVIGVPDTEWGETVVACYPAGARAPDTGKAGAGLAPHQRPKRFVALAEWPRNAQGKINRAALLEVVSRIAR